MLLFYVGCTCDVLLIWVCYSGALEPRLVGLVCCLLVWVVSVVFLFCLF